MQFKIIKETLFKSRMGIILLLIFSFPCFLIDCQRQGCYYSEMTSAKGTVLVMGNSDIEARFIKSHKGIKQEYFASRGGKWVPISSSFTPPEVYPDESAQLYNSEIDPSNRLILTEILNSVTVIENDRDRIVISLSGKTDAHLLEQIVSIDQDASYFHIEVMTTLPGESPTLEYVLSPFVFEPSNKPEFIHTPNLKFVDEDIFGDRTFYSPAVIMQEKDLFCALVPDLDIINEDRVLSPDARFAATRTDKPWDLPMDSSRCSFPAGLDYNLRTGLTDKPLFSYGMIDAVATHHMHWVHPNDGSMVRHLRKDTIKYGFDLMIGAGITEYLGYQEVGKHIWDRYGRKNLHKPRPQVMPFDEYAKIIIPASSRYQGWWVEQPGWIIHHTAPEGFPDMDSWQQWEMDGWPVGGYTNNPPDWYDMIEFATWWNNMRDAVGIYWWGQHMSDSTLIDKARRIVNLILLSPQDEGAFPVIYRVYHKYWQGNHWEPPMKMDSSRVERYFFDKSQSFQTAAMSKTCAHLLRYYRLCEPNERIIPFVKSYGDFIVSHIDSNGCLPAWFSSELKPNPYLRFNGEQGVHIWCLSELHLATKDQKYLDAAEKIALFMQEEILPEQRWLDFEVYFSCGVKPMNFKDPYTGQDPRGTISMSWAVEGFSALYRATGNKAYLDAGERVIDYLSLYQTVWAPHFIYTAYPFGGIDTDNGDAAWLNGHQAGLPGIFAWYGKELGRQDLIERSVALARASMVLVNLEQNVKNEVYNYPNFPIGLGPENIDHEGIPQTPLRTGGSWCEIGGLVGVSDAIRELGDLYINVEKNLAVGLNGIHVKDFSLENQILSIRIINWFSELAMPYKKPFDIIIKMEELPDEGPYSLVINGSDPVTLSTEEPLRSKFTVDPMTINEE